MPEIAGQITARKKPMRALTPALVRCWRAHCASFTRMDMRDKDIVYPQGHECRHAYYVASGYLKHTATDRDGHELVRAILHHGGFFGAISGRPRQRMQEAAVSKGPIRLYRCEANEFNALLDKQPDIARRVLADLSDRLAFAQRRTESILYQPAETRVALMLRELAGHYGGRCRHGHEIDIRLTQQELADVVGVSRPVVSTILNALRQRGIVSYTRAFICIDSMKSLERILD